MPSLVQIRPVVWEENGDKQTNRQTDRQTDTPFCFLYIDSIFYYLRIFRPQNA